MLPLIMRTGAKALGIAALCFAAVGCAITTAHLPINRWPIETRALYYQQAAPHRVVVLPLIDQRPQMERKGHKPQGMFLVLWNRRSGDYYTGDTVFGGDITGQLGERLTAYLQSANVFTDVQYTPGHLEPLALERPFFLRQMAQTHQADYLLGGELQHFFGSQNQHFNMYVLPLYFINAWGSSDSKSLPWGKTTIRFALIDGRSGDLLWRRPLEASHTLPREKDSMAEAALESFANIAGQLAIELRQLPLDTFGISISDDLQPTP